MHNDIRRNGGGGKTIFAKHTKALTRHFQVVAKREVVGGKVKCRMTRIFAFLEKVRTLAKVQIKKCFCLSSTIVYFASL